MVTERCYLDWECNSPVRQRSPQPWSISFGPTSETASVHARQAGQATSSTKPPGGRRFVGASRRVVSLWRNRIERDALGDCCAQAGRRPASSYPLEHPAVWRCRRMATFGRGRGDSGQRQRGARPGHSQRWPATGAAVAASRNSETGVLQDLGAVLRRSPRRGSQVHCDAVQAQGGAVAAGGGVDPSQ